MEADRETLLDAFRGMLKVVIMLTFWVVPFAFLLGLLLGYLIWG